MPLTVLIGGQFGSEGKGKVVEKIADEFNHHVRTGGPNAGHIIYHKGEKYAMQSIPCGWINENANLYVGAGAVIEPEILFREITEIEKIYPNIRERLFIDAQAIIITEEFRNEESSIKDSIGSTGKGVGSARRHKILRDGSATLAKDFIDFKSDVLIVTDTAKLLHDAYKRNETILLEGTQGSGLSLHHGPYPYVTSADTNASQFVADAGLPPHWVTDVIVVFRTFPIRVGGNSGPLYKEIDFDKISEIMGKPTVERTTVTKKVRRIGEWDHDLFKKTLELNAPTKIALTFVDYLNPEDEDIEVYEALSQESQNFIYYIERTANCPVAYVSTGVHTFIKR